MKKIYILLVLFVLIGFQTLSADTAKSKIKSKQKGIAEPAMTQLTRIVPEDGAWNDFFGVSTALWDDTAVVGAHRDDDSRGAAYIFKKDQGGSDNWGQVVKLIADDRAAGHRFGYSVAVSGNAVFVGAPAYPSSLADDGPDDITPSIDDTYYGQGAVYIFMDETGADNWQQLDMCTADPDDGVVCPLRVTLSILELRYIQFGYSLAVWGDTLLVGAPGYGGGGGVFIFNRNDSGGTETWVQSGVILSGSGKFGAAVALSGDTVLVGAPEDSGTGAVYVYHRNQGGTGNWGQVTSFSGLGSGDNFGYSVALWGDKAVVGAPDRSGGGAAYVRTRNQGGTDNWGLVTTLTGGGTAGGKFGFSVSIWESIAVAGAWGENSYAGAAYVFLEDWGGTDNWGRVDTLTADDAGADDLFGFSVAVSGDTAMVGAPKADGIETDSGVAYAFGNPGITVKQDNTVISNGGTYDFGSQLAYAAVDVTFTIQNDGKVPLTVTTPITLDNIYEFQVREEPTSPIEAGGTTTFVLRFGASETGVKTALLSIRNSDYYRDPFYIHLTGTIIQPGIAVKGAEDFGTAAVNGDGVEEVFTITNNGDSTLNLTGSPTVSSTGDHASDFTVTIFPGTSEIAAGESTTFTVTFVPTEKGERNAVIRIPNDDPGNNPYDIDVRGTGVTGLPSVKTSVVGVLSGSEASCGGEVVSDGGDSVTARGVCWDTSENPTYPDSDHTEDGDGTGEFTSSIKGLKADTDYYVRAYAKNDEGVAYGPSVHFTSGTDETAGSGNTPPTVETAAVSDITETSAVGGGNVADDGGAGVTARGVCWSTSPNPTVSDDFTAAGSGTGEFSSNITGLTDGTTYYVRAYAVNSEGTVYGVEMSFTAGDPIISGTVTENGEPLSGVTLTFSNVDGAGTPGETTTDFNGEYSATVPDDDPFPDGWTGTVTPSETGYTFTPESKSYTGVTSDRLKQDFSGTGPGTVDPGEPQLSVSLTRLNYTVILSGLHTGTQRLLVSNRGGGTLNWTTGLSTDWITVSPASGTGDGFVSVSIDPTGFTPGEDIGTITFSDPDAVDSPVSVTVYVNVVDAGEAVPPWGEFDLPLDGAAVGGSVPITGWALDDVEVKSVKIYRDNDVYIGDALFVEGARPDIETAYSTRPGNYNAGWGYMLLTHSLPNRGNGTFTLHAVVEDTQGYRVTLGSKTITCDNDNAVLPFGAVDTPAPGEVVSGDYVNWGWALTPMPAWIPTDGSTISVYVNGENLGDPAYNVSRPDIAALFPGYANSNGAGGYFHIDTENYYSGVHTISWVVTDALGASAGIGSRFFTILDTGSGRGRPRVSRGSRSSVTLDGLQAIFRDFSSPLTVKRGFRDTGHARDSQNDVVTADENGVFTLRARVLERLVIHPGFAPGFRRVTGYLVVGGGLRPLPAGSTLSGREGTFIWQPGPGFFGTYRMVFIARGTDGRLTRKHIVIKIE